MPSRSEEITAFIIISVILANCLTALAVWYEIYYYIDDNGPETIKAILLDAAAAAAVTILFMGTVNIMMLLSNYVLDQYRKKRYAEAEERGERRNDERWRDWYNRMMEAKARDEDFDEPPPHSPNSGT